MKKLYEILYKRAPRLLKAINKKKFAELDRAEKRKQVFKFLAHLAMYDVIQDQLKTKNEHYNDDEIDALRFAAAYAKENIEKESGILEKI